MVLTGAATAGPRWDDLWPGRRGLAVPALEMEHRVEHGKGDSPGGVAAGRREGGEIACDIRSGVVETENEMQALIEGTTTQYKTTTQGDKILPKGKPWREEEAKVPSSPSFFPLISFLVHLKLSPSPSRPPLERHFTT